jgi:hypothetical protein
MTRDNPANRTELRVPSIEWIVSVRLVRFLLGTRYWVLDYSDAPPALQLSLRHLTEALLRVLNTRAEKMRAEVFHTAKNFVLLCGSVQLTDSFSDPSATAPQ